MNNMKKLLVIAFLLVAVSGWCVGFTDVYPYTLLVEASKTANVTYSNATWTADTDLVEAIDRNGEFDVSTGKFTSSTKQRILVVYRNRCSSNVGKNLIVAPLKNSSPGVADLATFWVAHGASFPEGSSVCSAYMTIILELEAGDYFYMANYLNDTGSGTRAYASIKIVRIL